MKKYDELMRKLFVAAMFLTFSLTGISFGCEKCNNNGYVCVYVTCPLCMGHGTVSPAYYNKSVGVTRWTEESSYIGGVKIGEWSSEKKYKKYSMDPCPICRKSSRKGSIKTCNKCDCKDEAYHKKQNERNYSSFERLIGGKTKIEEYQKDFEIEPRDSFYWTKLSVEKGNWNLDNKNKTKVLMQAILNIYDVESANYKR